MADSNEIGHFVLTECDIFSLSDIFIKTPDRSKYHIEKYFYFYFGLQSGVTILKPLHGSNIFDSNLYANLETFFTLEYPKYEIIFCIQDRNPQLDLIVENLRGKYPNISSDVVYTGNISVGENPKINNLYPGYKQAKYDYILISDSKIRMR